MDRSFPSWILVLPLACGLGGSASADELADQLRRVRAGDPPAWQALGMRPGPADWARLLRAATDPRPDVQRGAVVACGWDAGGPAGVDRLLEERARQPGPTQDAALASLAARERDAALLAALLEGVRSPQPEVALDRLSLLRESSEVSAVCRQVFGAEGAAPQVQLAVLRRLGELRRPELAGWIKQFDRQARSPQEARRLACVALVAELRAGTRDLDETALQDLIRYMVDPDLKLYPDAIAGLRLFDPTALFVPMRSYLVRGDARHRFRLFAGIKELGLAESLRAELEEILLDPDEGPWIRQGAIDALSGIEAASAALTRLLQRPSSSPTVLALKRQAVSQLGAHSPRTQTRQAVEALLASGERTLRVEALRTLRRWGLPQSQAPVRALMLDARTSMAHERAALVEAAGACESFDADTVRVLREWTREVSDPYLAQALVGYASKLPDLEGACPLLIELLDFRALGQELLGRQIRADAADTLNRLTKAQIRYDARVQPFDARGRERWLAWWRSHQRERNQ